VANVKISELTAAGSAASTDLVEIAQDAGGGSYNARSATVANIRAGLATSGAVTGTGITMATARLLGRTTASTGAIEEISVSGLGLTGGTLSQGAGAWVEISRATASSSATIDFTGIGSTYDEYRVEFFEVIPATDDARLLLRTSTDGGSTYASSADDYFWSNVYSYMQPIGSGASQNAVDEDTSATSILVAGIVIDAALRLSTDSGYIGATGHVMFSRPSTSTPFIAHVRSWWRSYHASYPYSTSADIFGSRAASADVDAIRFLMDSGNITSGTFVLLGRKK
jgi:hypothetical protein